MSNESILENVRKKIAAKENLVKSTIKSNTDWKKGDGLIALISNIKIQGFTPYDQEKQFKFVLKLAPTIDVIRQSMSISKMYETEVCAYEMVLPEMRKFVQSKTKFINTPVCYATNLERESEYLVLEDLKTKGYRMWDCKKTADDRQIRMVFAACARFHAVSFALREKIPELWARLVNEVNRVQSDFFGEATTYVDSLIKRARKLDAIFDPVQHKTILDKFVRFREEELKTFMAETIQAYDPNFILVHGDMWSNNILFKYEDPLNPEEPSDLAILDWQGLRLSSFALDLSNFFYLAASKQALDDIDVYLGYYYESLCDDLRTFELDPNCIFPREILDAQWKKYSKFGFVMALVVLHGVTCESYEYPSLDEAAASGKTYWDSLDFISKNQEVYYKRVRDVILHFVQKDYL